MRQRRRRPSTAAAIFIVAAIGFLPNALATSKQAVPTGFSRPSTSEAVTRLVRAYPSTVRAGASAEQLLVNSISVPIDQNLSSSSFAERVEQADILDQLALAYPRSCPVSPSKDFDPGRLRSKLFFAAMYGGTEKAVGVNLRNVDWFGQTLRVTRVNGVDDALRKVAGDLEVASKKDPSLLRYLTPSAGAFMFRNVAGSKQLSVHAYGAAIDINTKFADYWRWVGSQSAATYRNRIPCEIGEVFERHGFIWGAKWYHFDTMHFEYRPELLL